MQHRVIFRHRVATPASPRYINGLRSDPVIRLRPSLHSPCFSISSMYVSTTNSMNLLLPLQFLAATQLSVALAQECRNTLKATYTSPIAAGGWTYRLIANGLTRPRSILFDNQGALLVVDANSGVKHLKLTDDGGTCLSVAEKRTIIDSPEVWQPRDRACVASLLIVMCPATQS